jgi:glycosyl transferase family 25
MMGKISAVKNADDWPIFILSLKDATERRKPLLSSLQKMGFCAEILVGVDGRRGLPAWAEEQIIRRRVRWGARPMTDGEFGCALSHANAYRTIIGRELPGAIIFEDDARITQRFQDFMEIRAYEYGEMMLLGHRMCWVNEGSQKGLGRGMQAYNVSIRPHLAHAYAVSHAIAKKLLLAASPVREPADWPCDISKFDTYALDPQVAYQKRHDFRHSHLEETRQEMLETRHRFIITNKRRRKIMKCLHWSYWITERKKKRCKRLS